MSDDCLLLISGSERLVLNQTDGQETLARAAAVFRYIDSNFKNWGCDLPGLPTKETLVQVYEMARDSSFREMFGSFGVALDSLVLTQAQIKQFVARYRDWLKKGGNGTFFLTKVGNEFFVLAVYFFADGSLGVRIRRLTLDRVLRAEKRHRVVSRQNRWN
jgi:hypothetical protein